VGGSIGHREWDAATYAEVSDPQVEWARDVIARIDGAGVERLVDAGCGTGRVTRMLAERMPDARILAVDASAQMVEVAREHLADLGDRVEVRVQDLTELETDAPVDLVFSNAVFHWIPRHDLLFGRIAAALRPGGGLVAQCGGEGNIAGVIEAIGRASAEQPFDAHLAAFRRDWHFASPDATTARLERAGFVDFEADLEARPVRLALGGPAEQFLETVVLRLHTERLPPELHRPFAEAVARDLADEEGISTLDYVRLNMAATRA